MAFYTASSFDPDRSVGYLIRLINQAVTVRLDPAIAAEGISYTQWQVLVSIFFSRGLTCAALARDLAHDKGAMTRLIDGLEQRGLVERERDADDRRVVNIALTEAGRDMASRGKEQAVGCWNAWLSGWSADEVEGLIAQLQRLRRAVEAAPERCA